tara:strand:- start:56 stop:757 length:702 start_codon:yes stop_codon:yes gene_type:complete
MTDLDAPRPVLQRVADGRRGLGRLMTPDTTPAVVLTAIFIAVLVAEITAGGGAAWGLSGQALAEGRWHTLGSHMFAHAGLGHLWMNSAALLALTAPVMTRLGGVRSPGAWVRYGLLFGMSGLAGAIVFLALHPFGQIPMVGASGAICGLWGAATRIGPDGDMVPLRSSPVWTQVKAFLRMNLVLFAVLFGLVWLSGGQGGLAWEAHLGGFLFGLLAMPRLVPILAPAPNPAPA